MIAVVDYSAGNLASVLAALDRLGHAARITSRPEEIAAADRVIFPGVGAAGSAMGHLRRMGLVGPLRQAMVDGKPFLGICLGFQILFDHSDEDGGVACLGMVPGRVVRFPEGMVEGGEGPLKVPHMGWNGVVFRRSHPVWAGIPEQSEFYFVHSYYPQPEGGAACGFTRYGVDFASAVEVRNLVAFQFHPEKSGRPGLQLLENFCRWTPG